MISAALPIETPEGISFTYELASLTDRGRAYMIDLLIRIAVVAVVAVLFAVFLGPAILAGLGLWLIIYFVVEWGYYVVFDLVWDGQSPGKRLFELRVIKSAGHPIGFYDSALRNLLRAADIVPFSYAAGVIAILCTRRFQRLGDLAADTIVVHERKAWFAGQAAPGRPETVQADLRKVTLSNRERRLLQEFMMRKDRLHPDRRDELAEILATAYRKHFSLPAEADATALLSKLYSSTLTGPGEKTPEERRP
jgi:uncharacterized RDD family membrane protein YckC